MLFVDLFRFKKKSFCKQCRSEYFREAVPNEGRVSAVWRSKEDFAKEGIPPALLDIMKRCGTLQQGKWNERKIFEYRFEVNPEDGLFARMQDCVVDCSSLALRGKMRAC